jgi:hypothetical protein
MIVFITDDEIFVGLTISDKSSGYSVLCCIGCVAILEALVYGAPSLTVWFCFPGLHGTGQVVQHDCIDCQ